MFGRFKSGTNGSVSCVLCTPVFQSNRHHLYTVFFKLFSNVLKSIYDSTFRAFYVTEYVTVNVDENLVTCL